MLGSDSDSFSMTMYVWREEHQRNERMPLYGLSFLYGQVFFHENVVSRRNNNDETGLTRWIAEVLVVPPFSER